jgi:hypothetical protein
VRAIQALSHEPTGAGIVFDIINSPTYLITLQSLKEMVRGFGVPSDFVLDGFPPLRSVEPKATRLSFPLPMLIRQFTIG